MSRRRGTQLDRLRRRCEAMLRELELPTPFDPQLFCERLGEHRGRPISLQPSRAAIGMCGAYFATDQADYIFYEVATSLPHQDHIIRHELGHLLSGHESTSPLDESLTRALLPDVDPTLIRHFWGRTTYSAEEEQEAEDLAWLILERCGEPSEAPYPEADSPATAGLLQRFEDTLERPGHRERV